MNLFHALLSDRGRALVHVTATATATLRQRHANRELVHAGITVLGQRDSLQFGRTYVITRVRGYHSRHHAW